MKKKIDRLIYQAVVVLSLLLLFSSCSRKDNNYLFFYPSETTVKDIDGNVYHTIYIKGQTWMIENLKTTRYASGETIPRVQDAGIWRSLKGGACCNYSNDTLKASMYGRLYNWYAISKGKVCPNNWHVPYDYEWQKLTDTLGGRAVAGGLLKEAGGVHWQSNSGATDQYGFKALPGGYRDPDGSFVEITLHGYWWSGSPYLENFAWSRIMNSENTSIDQTDMAKEAGFSVRCIRDY